MTCTNPTSGRKISAKPASVDGSNLSHELKISRILTLAWCGVLIAISLLARNWGSVLEVGLTITSITIGSVLGIFALGTWSTRVRQTGGLIGMVSGLLVMVAVHASGTVAWPWYVLVGSSVTFAVGTLSANGSP